MNYADYCSEEKLHGRKPLSMKEWAAGRKKDMPLPTGGVESIDGAPVEEAAQALPDDNPNVWHSATAEPDPEPDAPERLTFFHPSRYHVEIMQAGQKVVINNSIVTVPHKTIEFTENHWTADMLDPQDREKAEWLQQCPEYRKGIILLVDEIIHQPRVEVRTGPRITTHNSPRERHPAGELSAPLN